MKEAPEKDVSFERVLFFSDAVVAIAITLLALELKIDVPENQPLRFSDLLRPWHQYAAFLLSFINIAGFWNTHRHMFSAIRNWSNRTYLANSIWLLFIVTLPFATSVLSSHSDSSAGVFLYAANIFLISACQNFIWDFSELDQLVKGDTLSAENRKRLHLMCNLDMLNGLLAIGLSLVMPRLAFVSLFFKIPIFIFMLFYIASRKRKRVRQQKEETLSRQEP